MGERLTQSQWSAIAKLLRFRHSAAAGGAHMVMVLGVPIGDAARAVELPYKDVHAAVGRVKKGLQLAAIAAQNA